MGWRVQNASIDIFDFRCPYCCNRLLEGIPHVQIGKSLNPGKKCPPLLFLEPLNGHVLFINFEILNEALFFYLWSKTATQKMRLG